MSEEKETSVAVGWSKYERDGKIGVLVSGGYGAGWSTWINEHAEQAAMDRRLIELSLGERTGNIDDLCAELWGADKRTYTGGWEQAHVEWVPKGTRFEIEEYDGSESLRILSPADGFVA